MENQDNMETSITDGTDNHSSTKPPHARLVCTDPSLDSSLEDLEIELTETEQTIGRAETNTVIIDYMRISRQHARIFPEDGNWVIEDVSSTNGLFVGKIETRQAILRHGEQISIASIPFRFELNYNNADPAEETKPAAIPKTIRKQLDQNPEATIVLQSSPFTTEQLDPLKRPRKRSGWLVAITLIVLLSGALLASILN